MMQSASELMSATKLHCFYLSPKFSLFGSCTYTAAFPMNVLFIQAVWWYVATLPFLEVSRSTQREIPSRSEKIARIDS